MKILNIADLFCGAGGTSSGAIEAVSSLGYQPKLTAINHWPVAVDTHTFNHPDARHLCTSIDEVNPRTLFKEGELNLLWASPECTHHSQARGGKPSNEQSRATAWCVPRWMEAVRPDVVLIENVPEFRKWGPKKNGKTFQAWFDSCCSMGYRGDTRVLCAADYGDPTTRRRLIVQFVRGRRKIVWPDATHAEDGAGGLAPWVPARDIIDWSLSGESIFDRKRPLSPKTMARIWAGLQKFGLRPFIVPGQSERKDQAPRTHSVECPAPTVTAQGHRHLAQPFIVRMHGTRTASCIDRPLQTVEAGPIKHYLAQPIIIPQRSKAPARSVDRPAPTVTTTSRGIGLAQPFLICMEHGGRLRSIDRPAPTVTTAKGGAIGLTQPFLVQVAHGNGGDPNGNNRRSRSIERPLPTVCGERGDMALCEPSLLPQGGGGALRPVSEPAPTIHCDGAVALVEPFLVNYYGTGGPRSVAKPLDTVTTKDRFGLVRPEVVIDGERYLLDIRFRMLRVRELASAQGFHPRYRFTGNKTEQVKQIGNAVPRNLARAVVLAAWGQNADVAQMMREAE